MTLIVEPHAEGAVLYVRAQPGGRTNAVRGEHDGCLKVSVTQVAERGKANEALVDVLAAALKVRRNQIVRLAGETDRRKKFLIRDVRADELRAKLATAAAS
jgi:uncharacterized protein YggU (UPF0235/DUF167 family)